MPMKATFTKMSKSTAEDWAIIVPEQMKFFKKLPDRILSHMKLLTGDYGGFAVDRLQHSLQTAERAAEAGEDDEYVVCALLHDIGDTLGSANHADVAAAILQPYVSEENHWMIKHHAIFQGYNFFHFLGVDRNMRDQFRETDHFKRTARFIAKYDDPSFDPDMPELALSTFEPILRRVFSQPKNSIYKALTDN
ncbi:MAG: HD domain-containing protein [Porticoccaceae bacterium]|nr:HD domain-containing protein [Porticoccaceae bacterium]MBT3799466.1 HD domain-containing protein [Porticoccaceae bacterium]MBT4164478.1 HD domain-containing protein [Porticoccaceae bacterium]MBT4590954.1 HD domain-containing protein [Porticoccaceae bacterium]MBT5004802.1 HD domain-containing protein [Porticoccaceae bacterium]